MAKQNSFYHVKKAFFYLYFLSHTNLPKLGGVRRRPGRIQNKA